MNIHKREFKILRIVVPTIKCVLKENFTRDLTTLRLNNSRQNNNKNNYNYNNGNNNIDNNDYKAETTSYQSLQSKYNY